MRSERSPSPLKSRPRPTSCRRGVSSSASVTENGDRQPWTMPPAWQGGGGVAAPGRHRAELLQLGGMFQRAAAEALGEVRVVRGGADHAADGLVGEVAD